ncbi:hypothetical protein [Cohnella laeviribosi]
MSERDIANIGKRDARAKTPQAFNGRGAESRDGTPCGFVCRFGL